MKREEFTSLPLKLALGIIYDMAKAKLEQMPAPSVPRPPKYDGRFARTGGFWWLSEMDLDSLRYWHSKKLESARSDSQYAEKDSKLAANMAKWIEWRELFPGERWSGKRGEDRATAQAPSREPSLNKWPERNDQNGRSGGTNSRGSAGRGAAPPPTEEDDYGF